MENNRNIWIDYLRSSLTLLVVAHHSSLAYTTFANFDKEAYINSTHAIVDTKRWVGLDIFENFNDVFFMSLMFLIGGLFISKSIARKGVAHFIKDRVYRLFLPFMVGVTVLMLIAYFPSFYVSHNSTNPIDYIQDFFTTEKWPVGPPWFIWVLFTFNILVAVFHPVVSKPFEKLGKKFTSLQNKPAILFLLFLCITWLLYVPLAYNIGAGTWTGIGPFDFQLSRVFLYSGYFLIGVVIGNSDFNNGIFSMQSRLVKHWWLWVTLAVIVYAILTLNGELDILSDMVAKKQMTAFAAWMIYYTIYSASCVLSSLAFITIFRKFIHHQKPLLNSLTENAYLIYLIHYIFVTWTQFLLLGIDISAFLKFVITLLSALIFSWIVSRLLRKIKVIRLYL